MKNIIYSILLFSQALLSQDKAINGIVLGQEANKALSFANVLLMDGAQYIATTQTDSAGKFNLLVTGNKNYTIEISHLGYESITVSSQSKKTIIINLKKTVYNLEPISYSKLSENKYKFFTTCDSLLPQKITPETDSNIHKEFLGNYLGNTKCWQYELIKLIRNVLKSEQVTDNLFVYFTIKPDGKITNIIIKGLISDANNKLIIEELSKNEKWSFSSQNGKPVEIDFMQLISP